MNRTDSTSLRHKTSLPEFAKTPRTSEHAPRQALVPGAPPAEFESSGLVLAAPEALEAHKPLGVSLAACIAALTEEDDEKIRLDHQTVQAALGSHYSELAALFGDVQQPVLDREGRVRRVKLPFRPSILTDRDGGEPIVLGPTRDSGTFGKIRDGVVICNNGATLVPVAVKEWRSQPIRPTKTLADGTQVKKSSRNRVGLKRNKLYSRDEKVTATALQKEIEHFETLSGPVGFWGSRCVVDKIYLAQDPMAISLSQAARALKRINLNDPTSLNHVMSFVRYLGAGLAEHLADIHRRGFVHVDGKAENVMLGHEDFRPAMIDFGGVLPINKKGELLTNQVIDTITYLSPEVALGKPLTSAHDVWLLGHSLLEAMVGSPLPLIFDQSAAFVHHKGAAERRAVARNHEPLKAFVAYRTSVMRDEMGFQLVPSRSRVSLGKVQMSSDPVYGPYFKKANELDPELTAFILDHLLDPEPEKRPTGRAAAETLNALAAEAPGEAEQVAGFLKQQVGESEPAQRLMKVAQWLTQPHIEAFGPIARNELEIPPTP